MPRYIDADELIRLVEIDALCNGGYFTKRDVKASIKALNTADVVPKSQYDLAVAEREANVKGFTAQIEQLNIEIQALRGAANSYKMHYEKNKNELAREIFEEFDKLTQIRESYPHIMTFNLKGYEDLKKKYCKRYFKEEEGQ